MCLTTDFQAGDSVLGGYGMYGKRVDIKSYSSVLLKVLFFVSLSELCKKLILQDPDTMDQAISATIPSLP